ncbi:hypothetical protein ACT7CZ_12725, partial [Bacillus cereus]
SLRSVEFGCLTEEVVGVFVVFAFIVKRFRVFRAPLHIGIDSKVVKMGWQLESSNKIKQLAYQLQVAKDRDFEILMFDSQK